jgi:hypothetical protein
VSVPPRRRRRVVFFFFFFFFVGFFFLFLTQVMLMSECLKNDKQKTHGRVLHHARTRRRRHDERESE